MSGSKGGEKLDYDGKEDIEFTVTDDVEVMPTFDVMGLREDLLRGIYAYGACYAGLNCTC